MEPKKDGLGNHHWIPAQTPIGSIIFVWVVTYVIQPVP